MPLLEARALSAGHGHMAVVRDLDLTVDAGEVVALIGPNGAGKTTTLMTLAGALEPMSGEIRFLGAPATKSMHKRCRRGLGYVTEQRSVIRGLTTAENLRIARVDRAAALEFFPELEPLLRRRAGLLSGGEQQMLTLARALGRGPKVLMADELSLGLAPLIVQRLLSLLRETADARGLGVLLVEQHVRQALEIADRVYVMRRGRVALSGTADEIRNRLHEIETVYLSGID